MTSTDTGLRTQNMPPYIAGLPPQLRRPDAEKLRIATDETLSLPFPVQPFVRPEQPAPPSVYTATHAAPDAEPARESGYRPRHRRVFTAPRWARLVAFAVLTTAAEIAVILATLAVTR